MRGKSNKKQVKVDAAMGIARLWCLRILMLCGGHRKFIERDGFGNDDVLILLGMDEYIDQNIEKKDALTLLRKMHADAESGACSPPQVLINNMAYILDRISLNKIETDLLTFAIMLHTEIGLEESAEMLGNIDKSKLIRHLALILAYSQRDISQAMSMNGQLAVSGLLTIDNRWSRDMKNKLDLMNGVADELLVPDLDADRLFSASFTKGVQPKLGMDSFDHVGDGLRIMKSFLEGTLSKQTEGVNILLYGLPGTGKSELVRTLTKASGALLYEVSIENEEGEPLSSKKRFSSYKLSQQLLKHTPKAVIMFDEVEDVFPEENRLGAPAAGNTEKKAWINRLLETNKVPAFWLSNKVRHIDPAFLRRFDYVMEMPIPTSNMREKIFSNYLNGVGVQKQWLTSISKDSSLLPAHIEKAAKVVGQMPRQTDMENQSVIEHVLSGTQVVLGKRLESRFNLHQSTTYDPSLIATNVDVSMVVEGLRRSGRGNLCLYGPPGTGKSAFGRHIADTIDRPLLVKRASDILSMWLGGTEKNIAEMFGEAKRENAVLLLDEADSFLRDRRNANKSWEVTQVNELLVQMEEFDGIFICSTNLMDELDQASLRRFALKVEFKYVTPEQAIIMLAKESVDLPSQKDKQKIASLDQLTPGDFAAVKKRMLLLGMELTASSMVIQLCEEVSFKEGSRASKIGFLH